MMQRNEMPANAAVNADFPEIPAVEKPDDVGFLEKCFRCLISDFDKRIIALLFFGVAFLACIFFYCWGWDETFVRERFHLDYGAFSLLLSGLSGIACLFLVSLVAYLRQSLGYTSYSPMLLGWLLKGVLFLFIFLIFLLWGTPATLGYLLFLSIGYLIVFHWNKKRNTLPPSIVSQPQDKNANSTDSTGSVVEYIRKYQRQAFFQEIMFSPRFNNRQRINMVKRIKVEIKHIEHQIQLGKLFFELRRVPDNALQKAELHQIELKKLKIQSAELTNLLNSVQNIDQPEPDNDNLIEHDIDDFQSNGLD